MRGSRKAAFDEAIFYDTRVKAVAISVEVSDGGVTLSGELPNFDEVRFANGDVRDVERGVGVRCPLTVDEG